MLVILFCILYIGIEKRKIPSYLKEWADEKDLEIVNVSYSFFSGPYFISGARGSTVFKITLENKSNKSIKIAWLCIGLYGEYLQYGDEYRKL